MTRNATPPVGERWRGPAPTHQRRHGCPLPALPVHRPRLCTRAGADGTSPLGQIAGSRDRVSALLRAIGAHRAKRRHCRGTCPAALEHSRTVTATGLHARSPARAKWSCLSVRVRKQQFPRNSETQLARHRRRRVARRPSTRSYRPARGWGLARRVQGTIGGVRRGTGPRRARPFCHCDAASRPLIA